MFILSLEYFLKEATKTNNNIYKKKEKHWIFILIKELYRIPQTKEYLLANILFTTTFLGVNTFWQMKYICM